jgi:hypothetical protein
MEAREEKIADSCCILSRSDKDFGSRHPVRSGGISSDGHHLPERTQGAIGFRPVVIPVFVLWREGASKYSIQSARWFWMM